ncbi:hypothetical protein ACQJBY_065847 [Aegilops geniculata]
MKAMFCLKSQRLPTTASDCDDGPLSSFTLLFMLICKSGGRRRMSLLQQSDLLGKPQPRLQACVEPVSGGAGEPSGAIHPRQHLRLRRRRAGRARSRPPRLRAQSSPVLCPRNRRIGLGIVGDALEYQPPPVRVGPPRRMRPPTPSVRPAVIQGTPAS